MIKYNGQTCSSILTTKSCSMGARYFKPGRRVIDPLDSNFGSQPLPNYMAP